MATKVGDVFVEMSAKDTQLAKDLATAQGRVDKSADAMAKKLGSIGKGMTIAGAAITAAFTKTFLDFTKYETKLIDMAKVTDEPFDKIEAKLKTLDPILGNSTELMSGYYQVISAGVKDPVEALGTLETAAMAAKAAHVEQSEVVKGITKMMEGYEGAIGSASEAADLLFSIEKEGQTSVAELIPVIGGLAKISSDVGVEQNAMAASLAVVSKTAGSTSEAATQYEAVISGLMKPTTDMTDAFKAIGEKIRGVGEGYKSAEEMIKDLGFVDALKAIQEHSDATGVSIADLFGRKEAMIGFSALGAEGFKTLDESIVSVGEGAGSAQKAFENWSESGSASIDDIKNTFSNFSADVGKQLAPMIKEIIGKVTEVITKISEWAKENPKLFETIVKVTAVIGALAAVGGPILMAIAAFSAISGVIGAFAAIATGPIGLVIAAIALLTLAWKTNFGGIQEKTKAVFEFLKGLFGWFVNFVSSSFGRLMNLVDGVINALKKAWEFAKTIAAEIKELLTGGGLSVEYEYTGARGASIPSYQHGTPYVPRTELAMVHKGEEINPPGQRSYDNRKSYTSSASINIQPGGIIINTPKFGENDAAEMLRLIKRRAAMQGYKFATA